MAKFVRVFTVVAADTNDLGRLDRNQQLGISERYMIHAPAWQIFYITGRGFGCTEQQARNLLHPTYVFDESVARLAIQLESAVFHRLSI